MRQVHRKLGAKALGATLLVSVLPSAFAVVLTPGDASPLLGTTAALEPELAGTVVADTIRNWTISTPLGDLVGRVQDRVVQEDVSKTLDFYTRIFVDNVPDLPGNGSPEPFSGIEAASRSIYSNYTTDVNWRIDGVGNTAPTAASRSADGSSLTFLFGADQVTPADLPDGSRLFHIKTNATAFNALGWLNLGTTEGASPNFTTWLNVYQPAPVPEPGTWAMLLAGVMGVVGVARRRLSS